MFEKGEEGAARHDIARNFKSIAELFKLRRSGACNFSAGSWYDPELSLYSPVILVKKEKIRCLSLKTFLVYLKNIQREERNF